MAETDFAGKSDQEIATWIANHEAKGVTDSNLYRGLVEEYARRTGRGLNADTSLAHLMAVAREGRFTNYGAVAKASGVPWNKARHAMNGTGGHLDQLLSICHARSLPLFPAICVNQEGVETGTLSEEALKGFVKGAERLGYTVNDGDAFLRKCQKECFDWGKAQGNG